MKALLSPLHVLWQSENLILRSNNQRYIPAFLSKVGIPNPHARRKGQDGRQWG